MTASSIATNVNLVTAPCVVPLQLLPKINKIKKKVDKTSNKKHFKETNIYVGMTMVKKNRDKMIISISKAYFRLALPA